MLGECEDEEWLDVDEVDGGSINRRRHLYICIFSQNIKYLHGKHRG